MTGALLTGQLACMFRDMGPTRNGQSSCPPDCSIVVETCSVVAGGIVLHPRSESVGQMDFYRIEVYFLLTGKALAQVLRLPLSVN